MTEEKIEQEIRHLIETATSAVRLSKELFSQDTGLFAQLGRTREERERIVHSRLFREAQQRVRFLERAEVEFSRRKNDPDAREWKLLCASLLKEHDELRAEFEQLNKANKKLMGLLLECSLGQPSLTDVIREMERGSP